jgi:hypothetical protein
MFVPGNITEASCNPYIAGYSSATEFVTHLVVSLIL